MKIVREEKKAVDFRSINCGEMFYQKDLLFVKTVNASMIGASEHFNAIELKKMGMGAFWQFNGNEKVIPVVKLITEC